MCVLWLFIKQILRNIGGFVYKLEIYEMIG